MMVKVDMVANSLFSDFAEELEKYYNDYNVIELKIVRFNYYEYMALVIYELNGENNG